MSGQRDGFALGVDLGTSNTVAVLRWPDGRTRPLLVDGQPILPSGVYADTDGRLHVGRDALRLAHADPDRYEPNPKRRVDEPEVTLGDRRYTPAQLLGAVLRAVGEAAVGALGFLPPAVVTCPATWDAGRRQVLAEALALAGWPSAAEHTLSGPIPPGTRLLREPVAAARYYTEVLRRPVPVGESVAVFDFGGGTLDVAVVRNEGADPWGDSGFTVISCGGLDDLGGLDLDAALLALVGARVAATHPAQWARLSEPADTTQWRERLHVVEQVRGAKEMLSRALAAPVAVPGVPAAVSLTRAELEGVAAPLLRRAVAETRRVVAAAGLTPELLAGLFLVGGSSRIPLVARLLHAELGIAPTVLEQPELPVAEGALTDLPLPRTRSAAPLLPLAPVGAAPAGPPAGATPGVGPGGTLVDAGTPPQPGTDRPDPNAGAPALPATGQPDPDAGAPTLPASDQSDPAAGAPTVPATHQPDLDAGAPTVPGSDRPDAAEVPPDAADQPVGSGRPGPTTPPPVGPDLPRGPGGTLPGLGPEGTLPAAVSPAGPDTPVLPAGRTASGDGTTVAAGPPRPAATWDAPGPAFAAGPNGTRLATPHGPPPAAAPAASAAAAHSPAPNTPTPTRPQHGPAAAPAGTAVAPHSPAPGTPTPTRPQHGPPPTGVPPLAPGIPQQPGGWPGWPGVPGNGTPGSPAAAAVGGRRRRALWVSLGAVAALAGVATAALLYLTRDRHPELDFQGFGKGTRFAGATERPAEMFTALAGGRAYLAYPREDKRLAVVAVDVGTGKELWRRESATTTDRWAGLVALPGAVAVVADSAGGSDSRQLEVLDGGSQPRWRHTMDRDDEMFVGEEVVAFTDHERKRLVGRKLSNGDEKWTLPDLTDEYGNTRDSVHPVTTAETVSGPGYGDGSPRDPEQGPVGQLVQISADKSVRLIDLDSGKEIRRWKAVAEPDDLVIAHEDRLYVAGDDGRLLAYDLGKQAQPSVLYRAEDDNRRAKALAPCGKHRACLLEVTGSDDKTAQVVAAGEGQGAKLWAAPGMTQLVPVGERVLARRSYPEPAATLFAADGTRILDDEEGVAVRVDAGNLLLFADALGSGVDDRSVAGVGAGSGKLVPLGELRDVRGDSCSWNTEMIACGSEQDFVLHRFVKE
ncbi:Hsp70 family protein [Micromonospora sp. NPDC050495]|uniref:Hsp70 family protein n=1 Tax=Micromonospora sp. NPDC050495 TaxID=3154936 RepID=UPI0033FAD9B8